MKIQALCVLASAFMIAGCMVNEPSSRSEQAPSSYVAADEPFPVLNGYGNWIDVAPYGRVWQPSVLSDWRPYTNGRWVWSDRGWMWDTDEPFGWVVYHYGYWTQMEGLGWVWIPGNEWSPARVDWYSDNDYVCWAPMGPPRAHHPDLYQPGYENYWNVVPSPQFTHLNVGAYRVTPRQRSQPSPTVPATPTTPAVTRGRAVPRPPDIITIQGATHQLISPVKTEEEQVRNGRKTVARVRVAEEDRPMPVPVYVTPARPDGATPPSAPVYLPGAVRTTQNAPAVVPPQQRTPPPPVQQRVPQVRDNPAPVPARVAPAPAPVRVAPARVAPAPAPVTVAPAPAPVKVAPVVVPEKPQVKPEVKKEVNPEVKKDTR